MKKNFELNEGFKHKNSKDIYWYYHKRYNSYNSALQAINSFKEYDFSKNSLWKIRNLVDNSTSIIG